MHAGRPGPAVIIPNHHAMPRQANGGFDSMMREDMSGVETTQPGDGAPILAPILRRIPGVQHTQCLGDVPRIFARYPAASAIAVLTVDEPIGVICKQLIADVMWLPCYRLWIGWENCMQFISHSPHRLCIEASAADLARALARDRHVDTVEPFVVTGNGAYLGLVERLALLRVMTAAGHPRDMTAAGASLAHDRSDGIPSLDISDSSHGLDLTAAHPRGH